MFASSTANTLLSNFYSDVGSMLQTGIGQILIGMAALLVLGFVTRHVIRKITGKKF